MKTCICCGRDFNDFRLPEYYDDPNICPSCSCDSVCKYCGARCHDEYCEACEALFDAVEKEAIEWKGDKETVEVTSYALFVLGEDGIRDAIIDALKNVDSFTLRENTIGYLEEVQ